MSFAARVERLRALSITAGFVPTQLIMGRHERVELMAEIRRITLAVDAAGEPESYRGLVIVKVDAPSMLMVGTVTREVR